VQSAQVHTLALHSNGEELYAKKIWELISRNESRNESVISNGERDSLLPLYESGIPPGRLDGMPFVGQVGEVI
jgi:hypothetical protein